ncbi:MAG: hypothetical protein WC556_07375 [Candidatus Methanoperedens sp.]
MGCKFNRRKFGENDIEMEDVDNQNEIGHKSNNGADWWYHYNSRGLGEDKSRYLNKDFMLKKGKDTPDFIKYEYKPCKCHYQIGQNINIGSVVVMVTTVGNRTKEKYITGYYTVKKLGNCKPIERKKWKESKKTTISIVFMDKNDSLLVIDNPIKIDIDLAKKLFPKPDKNNYWEITNEKNDGQSFIQKVSSTTRNCHLTADQKKIILGKLKRRFKQGSTNYLGDGYKLLKEVNDD